MDVHGQHSSGRDPHHVREQCISLGIEKQACQDVEILRSHFVKKRARRKTSERLSEMANARAFCPYLLCLAISENLSEAFCRATDWTYCQQKIPELGNATIYTMEDTLGRAEAEVPAKRLEQVQHTALLSPDTPCFLART